MKFPAPEKVKLLKTTLKKAGLNGLTIREAAQQTGMMTTTASRYLAWMAAEKKAAVLQKSLGKIYLDQKAAIKDLEAIG